MGPSRTLCVDGALPEGARAAGHRRSGNHYVDVFSDETGVIWVGVHFGSRGLGHTIASGFLSQYAYAGREYVARKVVGILGGTEQELIHNHHNFAWKETHGGEDLIVVRKGATPAFPGQKGFVGGSMGDDSVILEGSTANSIEQVGAMYSTVHGAGRVMSRTQAAGKTKGWGPKKQVVSPGLISQEMLDDWLGPRGVILRGGGLDEAPQAYRRLPDVLAAQGETVRVLHTLRPIVVVMAGANEFDPYKD